MSTTSERTEEPEQTKKKKPSSRNNAISDDINRIIDAVHRHREQLFKAKSRTVIAKTWERIVEEVNEGRTKKIELFECKRRWNSYKKRFMYQARKTKDWDQLKCILQERDLDLVKYFLVGNIGKDSTGNKKSNTSITSESTEETEPNTYHNSNNVPVKKQSSRAKGNSFSKDQLNTLINGVYRHLDQLFGDNTETDKAKIWESIREEVSAVGRTNPTEKECENRWNKYLETLKIRLKNAKDRKLLNNMSKRDLDIVKFFKLDEEIGKENAQETSDDNDEDDPDGGQPSFDNCSDLNGFIPLLFSEQSLPPLPVTSDDTVQPTMSDELQHQSMDMDTKFDQLLKQQEITNSILSSIRDSISESVALQKEIMANQKASNDLKGVDNVSLKKRRLNRRIVKKQLRKVKNLGRHKEILNLQRKDAPSYKQNRQPEGDRPSRTALTTTSASEPTRSVKDPKFLEHPNRTRSESMEEEFLRSLTSHLHEIPRDLRLRVQGAIITMLVAAKSPNNPNSILRAISLWQLEHDGHSHLVPEAGASQISREASQNLKTQDQPYKSGNYAPPGPCLEFVHHRPATDNEYSCPGPSSSYYGPSEPESGYHQSFPSAGPSNYPTAHATVQNSATHVPPGSSNFYTETASIITNGPLELFML